MILLESFKEGSPFLGITELARITGFEKNLVQRLSNTLHKMGYLEKDEIRRKYYLSPRILKHSFNYLRSRKTFALAMPALIELREELRMAVNMCVLNGPDIIYVIRLWMKYYHEASLFGESLPAYVSAGGRMLLSLLPEQEARGLLAATNLIRLTPHTRTDPDELMEEVRKARAQGY
ncbi:IclR family transcriptional regulator, partial [Muribaculaceae bacterium Isolate-002 (NCI)]